jgi:sigma-B regulation protein RsbU (phosphoserine phosphatase)
MEHSRNLVYFKDADGRFIKVGTTFAERLNLARPEEAVGRTDFDFFTESQARQARDDERQVMSTGRPLLGRREARTLPDGRTAWMMTSKLPLRDAAGRIIGTFAVSEDITPLVKTQQSLRSSETRLRALTADRILMECDLIHARSILDSLLPEKLPAHPRLKIKLHYKPMQSIGGDFVALPALPAGTLGVFLGDLMGHGVAAALHLALLKFLSDRLLVTFGTDPKAYLEHLNRQVRKQMRQTFICGMYGLFQFREGRESGVLEVAGAGHHGPLVHRADTGALELVRLGGNAALGILDSYETATVRITLRPRDRVYLFTDGLYEAFNGKREILGMERLIGIFRATRDRSLDGAFAHVLKEVDAFRAGTPVNDDVVLAGFEVRKEESPGAR